MSLLRTVIDIVNRVMDTEASEILRELREECPKDTGKTAASFHIMGADSQAVVGIGGSGVTKSVLIGSTKQTAYWADQGNAGSGPIIYPKHARRDGSNKPPMLGKYPKGIPGYGWRASVHAYEGDHFVRRVADRHR